MNVPGVKRTPMNSAPDGIGEIDALVSGPRTVSHASSSCRVMTISQRHVATEMNRSSGTLVVRHASVTYGDGDSRYSKSKSWTAVFSLIVSWESTHVAIAVMTGASRGIGAAMADDLASRGYTLALCATSQSPRDGALCRSFDVADADAVERFASDVERELGPIDLWINNAAVLGPIGPVRSTDPDEWERCFRVNVGGVANGTRSFLAHRNPERATLVNMASRAAVSPGAGIAAYSATKAAVVALTLAVAREEDDVEALVVLPPSVDTDMQNTLLAQDEAAFPDVEVSRARQRAGGVLPAAFAARAILDAVLQHDGGDPVIDLTALAVGS